MENLEVRNIKLATIKVNSNNPRKTFNDQAIEELAQSIKAVGVLQPITVKNTGNPQDPYTFEIICGERRFRAAQSLGLETIPAIVRVDIRNDQMFEIALAENLLREDITPLEEMMAYTQFIEERDYTIEKLVARFGKSESHIRNRLKLAQLINEFRDLLIADEIAISTALVLCKFSHDVQLEVYNKRFAEGVDDWSSWRLLSAKKILQCIESSYTNDLEEYFFDQTECQTCPNNTQVASLFITEDTCGKCMNMQCLKAKNTAYIVERALQVCEKNPELQLAREEYRSDKDAVEKIIESGHEVVLVNGWCHECPTPPIAEEYETDEEYKAAYDEFITENNKITQKYKNGKIKIFAMVGSRGVTLKYRNTSDNDSVDETPITALEKKDERNKEIAIEKTIDDTKELVKNLDVTIGDFTASEEQIVYFAMAQHLRPENYSRVGISAEARYFSDKERFMIVQNLTEEIKTIIKRDYIIHTLRDAQRGNYTAAMLNMYAEQHATDQLQEITSKHNEEYDKRHARIEAKKALVTE